MEGVLRSQRTCSFAGTYTERDDALHYCDPPKRRRKKSASSSKKMVAGARRHDRKPKGACEATRDLGGGNGGARSDWCADKLEPTRTQGSKCDVQYDDGDREHHVLLKCVRAKPLGSVKAIRLLMGGERRGEGSFEHLVTASA